MRSYTLGLYKDNCMFPDKTEIKSFDNYNEAEEYCKKRNSRLKNGYWKIDVINN